MTNTPEKICWLSVLAGVLQRHVGRGQQISVECLAARAGVVGKTVYLIRQGNYAPSFDLAMRLVCLLPEEAAAEFFAAAGFTGLVRIDGVEGCHREAHYELATASAKYAEFWQDGRIDHREDTVMLSRVIPRVMTALGRLAARAVRRSKVMEAAGQ